MRKWLFLGIFAAYCCPLPAPQAPPPQKKGPAKAASPPAPAAPAEPAKPPAPLPEPADRRQSNYVYDLNSRPTPGNPSTREQRRGTGANEVVEREDTIRDFDGRQVPVRSSQERVLSEQEDDRTSERVVQRYDTAGRPTSKQLVRQERRKMPDGSIVSTETLHEQDVNGRMQFTERRTRTEKKSPTGSDTSIVLERPAMHGGTQVVERTDKVETRRSDTVSDTVTYRKFLDGNGRFEEREREASTATKSGNVTTTDSRQWQRGPTGQMDFLSRSLSRLSESPDGSQVEDVEVYSTKIGGTTPDLNRSGTPTLEQQVRREKKVQPNGKTVETTTMRLRQVAEPDRLGGLMVEEHITTPTADGKTIQKTVSERDANGRIVVVQRTVEEEKK